MFFKSIAASCVVAVAAAVGHGLAAPSNTTNDPVQPSISSKDGNLVVTVGAGSKLEYRVGGGAPVDFSPDSLQNYSDASLAAFKSGLSAGVDIGAATSDEATLIRHQVAEIAIGAARVKGAQGPWGPREIAWTARGDVYDTPSGDVPSDVLDTALLSANSGTKMTGPVVPNGTIEIHGFGFDQLFPIGNIDGLLSCVFTSASGVEKRTIRTTAGLREKSVGGGALTLAHCNAPAYNPPPAPAEYNFSVWWGDTQIPNTGRISGSTVTFLPTMVFEVGPDRGELAAGLAAPFVVGTGFAKSPEQYKCVWSAAGITSAVFAEYISPTALRCKRPDATVALLLDTDPSLRVTIVVTTASGNTLLNGDHPEHEFEYASGACNDGHLNGGEVATDCGLQACGATCAQERFASEGGLCDKDEDCIQVGGKPYVCRAEDTSDDAHPICTYAAYLDCATVKAKGLPTGEYLIDRMRADAPANVFCQDGWALMARATVGDCQAHWNRDEVGGISDSEAPQYRGSSTRKFSDSDIRAYRDRTAYNGRNSYRMEATSGECNGAEFFCPTTCEFDAVSQANSGNRQCVACSVSLDGGAYTTNRPNSGTRGIGHHHWNDQKLFAWMRHPEHGNNCGFKSDKCNSMDGHLWLM